MWGLGVGVGVGGGGWGVGVRMSIVQTCVSPPWQSPRLGLQRLIIYLPSTVWPLIIGKTIIDESVVIVWGFGQL